jgi:hypothetical protein
MPGTNLDKVTSYPEIHVFYQMNILQKASTSSFQTLAHATFMIIFP